MTYNIWTVFLGGLLAIGWVLLGILIAWVIDNCKELACKHDYRIIYIYSFPSNIKTWNRTKYECSKCHKIKIVTD